MASDDIYNKLPPILKMALEQGRTHDIMLARAREEGFGFSEYGLKEACEMIGAKLAARRAEYRGIYAGIEALKSVKTAGKVSKAIAREGKALRKNPPALPTASAKKEGPAYTDAVQSMLASNPQIKHLTNRDALVNMLHGMARATESVPAVSPRATKTAGLPKPLGKLPGALGGRPPRNLADYLPMGGPGPHLPEVTPGTGKSIVDPKPKQPPYPYARY